MKEPLTASLLPRERLSVASHIETPMYRQDTGFCEEKHQLARTPLVNKACEKKAHTHTRLALDVTAILAQSRFFFPHNFGRTAFYHGGPIHLCVVFKLSHTNGSPISDHICILHNLQTKQLDILQLQRETRSQHIPRNCLPQDTL